MLPSPRVFALAGLLLAACFNESDREPDEVCDNVGYAIASRTLSCTGDVNLSNARFEAFRATIACTASGNTDPDFECVRAVNLTSCADVVAFGDDYRRWIAAPPSCGPIFGEVAP